MAWPVTLNGRTYTEADFEGQNYVDAMPDAFQDFVTQAANTYTGASASSVTIGLGAKTFTADLAKPWAVGTPLRIARSSNPSGAFMDGIVTAYNAGTGALTVNVVAIVGAATATDWVINISGGGYALTSPLPIANGGTGGTTAATALANLIGATADVVPGANNVQSLGVTGTRWKNGWFAGAVDVTGALTTSTSFTLTNNQNGETSIKVTNGNTGPGAIQDFIATDGTNFVKMGVLSSGYTTNGAFVAGASAIWSNSSAGLLIDCTGPILFAAGGLAEVARFDTSGRLGIGMTPTNVLDITQTKNGSANIGITNPSTGTAAAAQVAFSAGAGSLSGTIGMLGSGYTAAGVLKPSTFLINTNAGNGIAINTSGSALPIVFGQNGAEIARFETSIGAFCIGTTSPSQSGLLTVGSSSTGIQGVTLQNTSSGTTAYSRYTLWNGASVGGLYLFGTGLTPAGLNKADGLAVAASGSGGSHLGQRIVSRFISPSMAAKSPGSTRTGTS